MLAIQSSGVSWTFQDPVTKSQRVTNSAGTVTSVIDLDPWGGETWRSSNTAFQPHRYTSYERDANGGDDAMMRRHHAYWNRFDQPDPYDGSYDFGDPQSFNRYSYTQGDPVNFIDRNGLEPNSFCSAEYSFGDCGGWSGFWGGNFGGHVAEYNYDYGGLPANVVSSLQTYNERLGNALSGNGFKTNAELTREFEIRYGYDENGNLHTSFTIEVNIYFGDPFGFLTVGARDSWPPDWPLRSNGYDPKFGYRTLPAPEMEQFPEKIGLGPKGVEIRREFDPTKIPSNASRSSQLFRTTANWLGKFLTGFFSIVGGTTMDIFGIMVGPSSLADPCTRNPYDPRCRKAGPKL